MTYVRFELDIKVDKSEVERELFRLSRGPTWFTHKRLDQVLLDQFLLTQAAVHVLTGSLKASGAPSTSMDRDGDWQGEISYGGTLNYFPSPGPPRNPGRYAIFEFEKELDEEYDHNWLRAGHVEDHEHRYADVLADWLRDDA